MAKFTGLGDILMHDISYNCVDIAQVVQVLPGEINLLIIMRLECQLLRKGVLRGSAIG